MGQQASKTDSVITDSSVEHINEKQKSSAFIGSRREQALSKGKGKAGVTEDVVEGWKKEFLRDPTLQLSQIVLSGAHPTSSLISRSTLITDRHVFNTALKGLPGTHKYPGPVTNQKQSGRCWLFAATNVLRYRIMAKLNIEEFQLSQNYLFFWDKLEKCNYFLENMLDLVDEPIDGRLISFLNASPINDGGQFDMAINLVEKYGVVPQAIFPESYSSSASAPLNQLISIKLREFGLELRELESSLRSPGLTDEEIVGAARKRKEEMMKQIYNTLCITLGSPPKADVPFDYEYYDKDGKFQRATVTPLEFYSKYTGPFLAKDMFSLINDPRNSYDKLYTVDRLGNVYGGLPVKYVNAPISALEHAVITCIKADQPVFFGCDVGASLLREQGVMDINAYEYEKAYGYKLNMDKAQRILTCSSAMTHAMVITAVHLDASGNPVRYRIENSWSDATGDKGFYLMTAEWFKQYVYQVVIPKKLADDKYVKIVDGDEAIVLPCWDPMGALA